MQNRKVKKHYDKLVQDYVVTKQNHTSNKEAHLQYGLAGCQCGVTIFISVDVRHIFLLFVLNNVALFGLTTTVNLHVTDWIQQNTCWYLPTPV